MKKYACNSDVFRGDIITINSTHYIVVDSMNSSNGNFKAKDSKGRIMWFNTVTDSFKVDRRKDSKTICI